ncbi:hypothetical protein [Thermomonas sp. HDW16]|uniref:hypothetical protein n=1 Tax=Thermomonas sp. HDW16 TaxID=2714945 RepID=UPI00140AC5D3|nr:hypothetical protein [Thermomonas sp. HDW16]QIL20503.1 hypothetical protein G7079_07030 [Thermomonas sp. HDW16]
MAKTLKITAFVLFAAFFAANVSARDFGKPDKIVLEAKTGSVMTSTGGQYEAAGVGKLLVDGESMMLGDSSKATVVYYYLDDEGKVDHKCVEKYDGANTYVIDDSCKVVAWLPSGRASAGIIIGAGLVGAAILSGMDDAPVGPISVGPNGEIRHF